MIVRYWLTLLILPSDNQVIAVIDHLTIVIDHHRGVDRRTVVKDHHTALTGHRIAATDRPIVADLRIGVNPPVLIAVFKDHVVLVTSNASSLLGFK